MVSINTQTDANQYHVTRRAMQRALLWTPACTVLA